MRAMATDTTTGHNKIMFAIMLASLHSCYKRDALCMMAIRFQSLHQFQNGIQALVVAEQCTAAAYLLY